MTRFLKNEDGNYSLVQASFVFVLMSVLLLGTLFSFSEAGQLLFDGVPVDITTTDNEDLVITPGDGGNTQIGDSLNNNDYATTNDDLYITGILEVDGRVYAPTGITSATILPIANSLHDLGNSSTCWANVYLNEILSCGAALTLTPASGYSLLGSVTKSSTGDEYGYLLSSIINKTSGNYTALKVAVTETAAPGTADKLLDMLVGTTSYLQVYNGANSANYGLVSIGPGPWNGSSLGFFNGSTNGTQLAINSASSFTGNLVDFQVGGVSKFSIDKDGNVFAAGSLGGGGAVTGTGTANRVAKWSNASTLTSSGIADSSDAVAVTIDSSENIGVGTTSPTGRLDVQGDEVRIWTGAGTNTNAVSSGELYVEGDLEVDGVLYGDASGLTNIPSAGWTDGGTTIRLTTASDLVGVGTTTAQTKLHIYGASGLRIQDDGTNNYLTLAELSSGIYGYSDSGVSSFVFNGQNVGIGSTSPASLLDIAAGGSGLRFGAGTMQAYGGSPLIFQFDGTAHANMTSSGFNFLTTTAFGNNSSSLTSSGRIAIGTLNPTGALDVRTDEARIWTGAGTNTNANAAGELYVEGDLEVDGVIYGDGSGLTNITTGGWSDSGTNVALQTQSDNVGIGTTSPVNKLDVEGATVIGAAYSGTSAAPTNGLLVEGNVGIGSNNPSRKLDVAGDIQSTGTGFAGLLMQNTTGGTGRYYSIYSSNAGNLILGDETASQVRLLIDNAGNIGLGSTSPQSKLDVNGTVTATAFVGDGSGLTGITSSGWTDGGTSVRLTTTTDLVAIGTTTASSQLDIEGSTASSGIDINNTAADGDPQIAFQLSGTNVYTMGIDDSDGDKFKIGEGTINTETLITLDSTNNMIGIGTTEPNAVLTVPWKTGDPANTRILAGSTDASNGTVGIWSMSGSNWGIYGYSNTERAIYGRSGSLYGIQGSSDESISGFFRSTDTDGTNTQPTLVTQQTTSQTSPLFQARNSSGTQLVTITSTGTVGVGTATPTGALDVRGDELRVWTGSGTNTNATSAGEAYVEGDLEVDGVIYGDGSGITGISAAGGFTDGGTTIYNTTSTDLVSIGSTSASALLQVEQTAATDAFRVNDQAGDASPFVIDQSGNVGVGTTLPTQALTIGGTDARILMQSATSNEINFSNIGAAAPSDTSAGWKIRLRDNGASSSYSGFGIEDNATTFFSSASGGLKLYLDNGSAYVHYGTLLSGAGGTFTLNGGSGSHILLNPSSGSVAIGTTSPTGRLDIRGDEVNIWTGAGTNSNATSSGELYVEGDLEVDGVIYGDGSGITGIAAAGGFTDGGTNVYTTTLTDNVGIGTSTPSGRLDVEGGDVFIGTGTLTNASGSEDVSITGNLEVDGTIYGTVNGYVPTSRTLTGGTGIGTIGDLSADRTINLDLTELSTATFGAGSFTALTFDSGATDPVMNFGSNLLNITSANVGIGSSSPRSLLDVNGTVTATAFVGDGSGLTGITSSGWTDSGTNVALTTSTDAVGIGTGTPTGKLDVRGDEVNIWTGGGTNTNATSAGELYVEGDLEVDGVIYGNGSGITGIAAAGGWTDGGTNVYLTTSTDRVGIGTTVPAYTLDVNGQLAVKASAGSQGIRIIGNAPNYYVDINMSSTGAGFSVLPWLNGVDYQPVVMNGIDFRVNAGPWSGTHDEKLRIDSTGNMGLGTTSPSGKLDVEGGDVFIGTATLANASGGDDLSVSGNLEVDGLIYGDGSQLTGIASSGWTDSGTTVYNTTLTDQIGVGTSSTSARLHVEQTAAADAFRVNDAAGDTTPFVIDQSGNVGIGTMSSSVPLTVVGILQVAGSSGAGYFQKTSSTFDINDGYSTLNLRGQTGIQFQSDVTATRMFLNSSGNFGIGTTSPSGRLDVEGGDVFIGTATLANASGGDDLSVSGNLEVDGVIYGNGSGITGITAAGGWTDGGTSLYNTTSTDKISIGSTVATSSLDIVGVGTTSATSSLLVRDSAGTNLFKLQDNGYLGLGSTSPTEVLDLSGRAKLAQVSAPSDTTDKLYNVGGALYWNGAVLTTGGSPSFGTLTSGSNTAATMTVGTGGSLAYTGSGVLNANQFKGNSTVAVGDGGTGTTNGSITGTSALTFTAGAGNNNVRLTPTGSGYTLLDGNVGIGTTVPGGLLSVGSTSQFQVNTSGAVTTVGIANTGSALTNAAAYTQSGTSANTFTGTSTFSNGTTSALFTGGGVGIGTTSPTGALDVRGDEVRVWTGSGSNTNATSSGELYVEGDLEVDGILYGDGSGLTGITNAGGFTDAGTYVYTTAAGDNVGLGTTTPTVRLDIESSGASDGIDINNTAANGDPRIAFQLSGTTLFTFGVDDSDGDLFKIGTTDVDTGTLLTLNSGSSQITSYATILPGTDNSYALGSTSARWQSLRVGTANSSFAGNLGIGTANPSTKLDVVVGASSDGITINNQAADGDPTLALQLNDTPVFTLGIDDSDGDKFKIGTTAIDTNTRLTIDSTGKIGIGTTIPAEELSVTGDIYLSGGITGAADTFFVATNGVVSSYATYGYQLGTLGAMGYSGSTLYLGAHPDLSNSFNAISLVTNGAARALLDSNGNLGIGTDSPTGRLDVRGDEMRVWTGAGSNANATSSGELYVEGDLEVDGVIYGDGSGITGITNAGGWTDAGTKIYQTTLTDQVGVGTSSTSALLHVEQTSATDAFRVNDAASDTTPFVIDQSGNVGIGSASPLVPLDVVGNIRTTSGSINSSSGNGYLIGSVTALNNSSTDLQVGNNSFWQSLSLYSNNDLRMRIDSSGNVGIGTTTPVAAINSSNRLVNIHGASANGNVEIALTPNNGFDAYLGTSSNSALSLVTNGVNRLKIDSSGNIGVGTTVPSVPLDVIGTTKSTAFISTGSGDETNPAIRVTTGAGTGLFGGGYLAFAANGVEAMRILSGGNVGIGTNSPTGRLDVRGDEARVWTGAGTNSNATSSGELYVEGDLEVDGVIYGDGSGITGISNAGGWTDGGTRIYQTTLTDQVGVGTSSTSAMLHVEQTAATDALRVNDSAGDTTPFVIDQSGNVGVGSSIPTVALDVNGSLRANGNLSFANNDPVFSSGNNRIMFSSTTTLLPSGSSAGLRVDVQNSRYFQVYNAGTGEIAGHFTTNGELGIGTNAPTGRLDVRGDEARIWTGAGTNSNATSSGELYVEGDLEVDGVIYGDGSGITGITNAGGWTDAGTYVTLTTSTDFVGIGTSAPQLPFVVQHDSGIRLAEAVYQRQLNLIPPNASGGAASVMSNSGNGMNIGLSVNGAVNVLTNGTTRMTVDTNGNLGVGTTLATGRLDVRGDEARIWTGSGTNDNATSSGELYVEGDLEVDGVIYGDGSGITGITNAGGWTDAGTKLYQTTLTDQVGVGTSSTSALLHVEQTAAADAFRVNDAASDTTPFVIDQSGNVGIGTSQPTNPLQVNVGATPYFFVGSGGGTYVGLDLLFYQILSPRIANENTTSGANLRVIGGGAVNSYLSLQSTEGVGSSDYINFLIGNNGATEAMRITSNGNVGIGTNSPTGRLDVRGDEARVWTGAGTNSNATSSGELYVEGDLEVDGVIYGDGSGITGITNAGGWTDAGTKIYQTALTDQVGVGTSSTSAMLQVEQVAAADAFRVNDAAGDTTPFVIDQSGNVGVGTTTSTYNLTVNGAYDTTIYVSAPGADAAQKMSIWLDQNAAGGFGLVGQSYTAVPRFSVTSGGPNGTERLVVTGAGNVGIGTTAPTNLLSVGSTSQFAVNSSGQVNFNSTGSLTANQLDLVASGATATIRNAGSGAASVGLTASGTGSVILTTGGSERARVDSSGNLGIGTSSPSGRLDVEGGDVFIGTATLANASGGDDLSVSGNLEVDGVIYGDGSGITGITNAGGWTDAGTKIYQTTLTDQVGVGTSSTSALLHIEQTAATDAFRVNDAAGDTSPFLIDQSGNVGIGSATPSAFLHLSGLSIAGSAIAIESTDANAWTIINSKVNGNSRFLVTSANTPTLRLTQSGGNYLNFDAAGNVATSGSGVPLVLQNATGYNVAIGTSTASGKLDVEGGDVFIGTGTLTNTSGSEDLSVTGNLEVDGVLYGDGSGLTNISAGGWTDGGTQLYLSTSTDNVGIGTTVNTSGYQLDVRGQYSIFGDPLQAETRIDLRNSNGTLGRLTNSGDDFHISNQRNSTDRIVFNTPSNLNTMAIVGGQVGIGTISPSSKLDIESAASSDGMDINNTAADGDPRVAFQLSGTSAFTLGVDDSDSDKFKIGTTAIDTNTRMTIDSSGNVGIGTSVPSNKLHIVGGAAEIETGAFYSSATKLIFAAAGAPSSYYHSILTTHSDAANANNRLTFNVSDAASAGVNVMTLNGAGQVGIGTTVPSGKLDVEGGDVFIGTATLANASGGDDLSVSGNLEVDGVIYGDGSGITGIAAAGGWTDGGTNVYATTATDIVGIGTTAPSTQLDLESAAASAGIDLNNTAADGDPRVAFQLSGTSAFTMGVDDSDGDKFKIGTTAIDTNTRLTIDGSGYVGVGSSSPSAKLNVDAGSDTNIAVFSAPGSTGVGIVTISGQYGGQLSLGNGNYSISALSNTSTLEISSWNGIRMYANGQSVSEVARFGLSNTNLASYIIDNLGVGTTSPTGRLDVRGDEARIWTGSGSNANATSSGELYVEGDLEVDGVIYGDGSGITGITNAGGWTDAGTYVYTTTSTDFVGIGTSAPSNLLHAFANANSGQLILMQNASSGSSAYAGLTASNNNSSASANLLAMSSAFSGPTLYPAGSAVFSSNSSAGTTISNDNASGFLKFATGGNASSNERMRITSAGNVGIGTTVPGAVLDVDTGSYNFQFNTWQFGLNNGSVSMGLMTNGTEVATVSYLGRLGVMEGSPEARLEVSASGGADDLLMLSSNDSNDGNRFIVKNDGSVGIGTTGPSTLLDLESSASSAGIDLNNTAADGDPRVAFQLSGTSAFTMGVDDSDSDKFKIGTTAIDTNTRLTIDSSGRVGIGTTVPVASLQVGLGSYDAFKVTNGSTEMFTIDNTGNVGINVSGPTQLLHINRTNESNDNAVYLTTATLNDVKLYLPPSSDDFRIWTQGLNADALTVKNSTGYVGIGTVSPSGKLDVEGGDVFIGTATLANASGGDDLSVSGNLEVDGVIYGDGSGITGITNAGGWTDGGTRVYQTTLTDQVGVGTSSTSAMLQVEQVAAADAFRVNDAAGDTTPFVIDQSGNVGIGTTSPAATTNLTVRNSSGVARLEIFGSGDGNDYADFELKRADNALWQFFMNQSTASGQVADSFGMAYYNGAWSNPFWITPSGNIGLGTAAPSSKLDLESTSSADGLDINNTAADGDPRVAFQLSGTSAFTMGVDDSDSDKFKIGTTAIDTNTRLTIDSSGNVGIGTTVPLYPLSLTGGFRSMAASTVTSYLDFNADGNLPTLTINAPPGNGSVFRMSVNTSSLLAQYYLSGNSLIFQNNSGGSGTYTVYTILDNNGATNGYIGIGSTNPSQRLDVNGTVRATAFSGDGSGLTNISAGGWTDGGTNIYATTLTDNVAIGTSTASAGKLTIKGSGTGTGVGLQTQNSSGTALVTMLDNGNVGIGSSNPAYKLDMVGSLNIYDTYGYYINGGRVAYRDSSAVYLGAIDEALPLKLRAGSNDRMQITSTGDVGVGTTVPSTQLDLESSSSSAGLDLNNTAADGDPRVAFQLSGTSAFTMGVDDSDSDKFKIGTTAIDTNTRFTIDSSGNVGIGTVSPGSKLDVRDASSPSISIVDTTNTVVAYMQSTDNAASAGTSTNHPFAIGTNSTSRIYVESGGNVGIGTSVPSGKLDVEGGDVFIGTATLTNTSGGDDLSVSGNLEVDGILYGNGSGLTGISAGGWTDGGTNIYTTTATDSVGIGTTSPQALLHVNAGEVYFDDSFRIQFNPGATVMGIGQTTNAYRYLRLFGDSSYFSIGGEGYAVIAPNNSEKVRVTTTGRVGIGTTVPTVILDVESSSSSDGLDLNNTAADGDPRVAFQLSGTSAFTMGVDDSDSDKFKIGTTAIDTNTRLTIDSSGNVGIGTTAPAYLLNVVANANSAQYTGMQNLSSGASATATLAAINNDSAASAGISATSSGYNALTLYPASSAVFGSNAAAGTTISNENASGFLKFATGGTASSNERMRIDSSGNVGIGTTVPNKILDVFSATSGSAKMSVTGTSTTAGERSGYYFYGGGGTATTFSGAIARDQNTDDINIYTRGGGTTPRVTFQNGGNVGIGTSVPSGKLDVEGGDVFIGTATLTNTSGNSDLSVSGNLEVDGILYGDGSGLTNISAGGWTDGGTLVYLTTSSDNIAIGTTVSQDEITVVGANPGITLDYTPGGGSSVMLYAGSSGGVLTTRNSSPLILGTATGTSFYIMNGTDNVGIKDASPDYLLELYDPTNTPALGFSDDDIAHGLTAVVETDVFAHETSISTTDGGYQISGLSDTDATALSLRGFMGSTDPTDTTPAVKIVGAKKNTTNVQDLGANETVFSVANNDDAAALTILGNGNVGIGTATPVSRIGQWSNYSSAVSADQYNALFEGNFAIADTGSKFGLIGIADAEHTSGTVSSIIGTSALARKNGTAAVTDSIGLYAITGNYSGTGAITNAYGVFIADSVETGTITNDFGLYQQDSGAVNYFGGNVGIGTTAPSYKLDITDGTTARVNLVKTGANANTSYITNDGELRITSGRNLFFDMGASSALIFNQGGSELGRFDGSNGNLGIFDAGPDALLEVSASGGAGDLLMLSSNDTTDGDRFIVKNSGNVGIGTTVPSAKLSIGNNVASGFLDNFSEYQTLLYDGGTASASYGLGVKTYTMVFNSGTGAYSFDAQGQYNRMVIDENGNVGIGTTAPVQLLQVAGGAKFNDTVYFDETDDGNSGTSDTINWTTSNKHKSTLTGNVTYTFTAPGGPSNLVLMLIQDGTGGRTVTWPAAVKWPGGTAPVISSAANAVDIVSCYYNGTNYYCLHSADLR